MPQNKQKSGFRKGFLKKAPPPKPKQQASSALLDVEEQDQSPLLFVGENNVSESEVVPEAAAENQPLHVLITKDDECDTSDEPLGLTAVSTRRKSPLIQEVSSVNPLIQEESNSVLASRAKDDKPLLWEVPSPSETMATTSRYPLSPTVQAPLDPKEEPFLQVPPDIHSMQVNSPTSVSCQLVHELPNLLWKMKQQRRSVEDEQEATVQQFVSEFIQSDQDWIMAWTFLLNLLVKESADTTDASVRLGITLLQHDSGMQSFLAFLEPSSEKQARVLALGGTMLIHCYFKTMMEAKQSLTNMTWLTHIVPRLSNIVLKDPTKRSVLSHQCVTAVYDIVAIATSQENGNAHLDLETTLWGALSIIVELLQVQHGWIEQSLQRDGFSNSGDASRKQCSLGVIDDWRLVLKEALRLEEGLRIESKHEGALVRDERTRLTEYTCLQLTGDTLINGTEDGGFGSLHQTLSNETPKYTAQQIVTFMQDGTRLLQPIREKKTSDEVQSWQIERVRAILRGVSAWLGQSKKHLQSMKKISSYKPDSGPDKTCLEQTVDLSIKLLRVDTNESANLVLAILGNLWSSSNGLPPDFTNENESSLKTVPVSFELLLDELKVDSSDASDALDPTTRALCTLVARCILSHGASLVTELVKRNGKRSSTVEVLANILSGAHYAADKKERLVAAYSAFLDCLESNRYAQRKLVSAPETLHALPATLVIPRLISLASSNIDDSDLVQAVSAVLESILISSLSNGVDEVVQEIINSLGSCLSRQDDTKPNETPSNMLCRKITSGWRRILLENPKCGTNGLASVLSAIANAMFADPSSSIPLELLGRVVGDELVLMDPKESKEMKVYFAVMAVVRQCLNSLENTENDAEGNKSIYSRLSPLLLLRRIPSGYYKVAWSVILDDKGEREAEFSQLVNQLSDRLDIPSLESSPKHVTFTAEERQLAAEIAGRCIPFYDKESPSCSCYQRICFPSFTSTLCTLQIVSGGQKSIAPKDSLRAARVALYACCTHLPLAEDNEAGEGILGTVSFVLEILNVNVADVIKHNVVEDELIQLQTGCIEYLAACLESTLQRHIKNQKANLKRAVIEVESNANSLNVTAEGGSSLSTKDALSISCTAIASCLRAGSPVPYKLRLRNNGFLSQGSNDKKQELSTSARTCMWNSFLVVSQRCPDDRLASWANLTAPWVLDWASAAPVDQNLCHPLCMAAALQILFILVTRTKSFDCLGGGRTSPNSVRKAHRLSVTSIKTETNIGGDYARIAMRRAGLKLLLALVTIDQMDTGTDLSGCLSPGELAETLTLLNGTANVDTDAEVRNLAAHILTGMRTS